MFVVSVSVVVIASRCSVLPLFFFNLNSLSDVHTVTLLPCLASIVVTTFLSKSYESFELRTVGNLIY